MYRRRPHEKHSLYERFDGRIDPNNRWVLLSKAVPWDELEKKYMERVETRTGRPSLSFRQLFGASLIQHINGLSDRETVNQIVENRYYQYLLGFDDYISKPFSHSM